MTRFSAAVPRRMYWSTEVGGTRRCPECGAGLENELHTYLMAVREGGDVQPYAVGASFGFFCVSCPVVVLDHEAVGELAEWSSGRQVERGEVLFTVLGLVDVDAVPEEQADVALGGDDNPIPLVKFSNLEPERVGGGGRAKRRARRKGKRRKNKRR